MFRKYTDGETYGKIVDYKSVGEMWAHSVGEYADKPALTDGEQKCTYSELDKDVAAFRSALAARGVEKGMRVGVLSENSCAFVKAFLAITTLGATAVLLPPHLDEMTVFGCSMKYGLKAIVNSKTMEGKTAFAKEKNPALTFIDIDESGDGNTPAADVAPEEPCVILFTGGTTGKSKGALLSHRAVMRGTKNGCYGYPDVFCQKYFLVLPMTHVFGLIRNTLTPLYTGSELFICKNNKNMFKDMQSFRPTILVFIPAFAEMALGLSKQFGTEMTGGAVKYIICGAATVPPYLRREYAQRGITLFAGYGLTESANLSACNPEPVKDDSVGFPYPEQEIKIVDGELWLKGPNMMDGYVGEDEENKLAFSEDGWFKTGDLVRQDDEGFLYIIGRVKELIVLSSGEKVSPAEFENRFNSLDLVQDSLIYADENADSLILEVLPRASEYAKIEGDKEKLLREQLNEINRTLPSFARVSKIIVRDTDFKRSPSMKILRNRE